MRATTSFTVGNPEAIHIGEQSPNRTNALPGTAKDADHAAKYRRALPLSEKCI
jgi:hypothetical protein